MEISLILRVFKQNYTRIAAFILLGALLGALIYLLPEKYLASGSLYITREIETSQPYFSYEGYYAQQTASAYTNTTASMLESIDVRFQALQKTGIPTTNINLRKYQMYIDVKKKGPQLITLVVKEKTAEKAEKLWNALSETLRENSAKINGDTDNRIKIVQVLENPVVKPEYKSIYLNTVAGAFAGLGVSVMYLALSYYLNQSKSL